MEDPDVTVILPGWESQEVILYALVAYDGKDVVDDIDWGIYPHEKEEDSSHYMSPIRSARLQAGGFYFAAFNRIGWFERRHEMLLASPSVSDQAFEIQPPPGMCSAILLLKPMEDGARYERLLYLDGKQVVVMPLASGYWYKPSGDESVQNHRRVFIKLLVGEGVHEIKITTIHSPTEFRRTLECLGGQVFYVYPRHKVVESVPWSMWRKTFKIEGDIAIYDHPIESSDGWKRLLFYSGNRYGRD